MKHIALSSPLHPGDYNYHRAPAVSGVHQQRSPSPITVLGIIIMYNVYTLITCQYLAIPHC